MKNKKSIFLILTFLVMIIAQTGCGRAPEPVSREEYCLDTICSVGIYRMKDAQGEVQPASKLKDEAEAAADDAFKLCSELEDKLSRTIEGSDISRVNAAGGAWTEVSADTIDIVERGLRYSELSGGDFDITIGGVTELWDFHAPEGEAKLPDEEELAEAVKHVDYKNVKINGNMLRIADPKAEIDLGGIAKGYIGDRMTGVLEDAGVVSATVNLGGNVICIGGKSDDEDFAVGIETPFSDRSEIIGKTDARDETLVTSGVYERRFELDGKLYHHILDPETGYPAVTDLDAVTLTGPKGSSADLDALSTICLIKGAKDAKELIEKTEGTEAVFILNDGTTEQTAGMRYDPS